MDVRVSFAVFACWLGAPLVHPGDGQAPVAKPPERASVASESAVDGMLLLEQLKRRDLQFDNRSLEIEKRWTEHINPYMELAQHNFNNRKYGGPQFTIPPEVKISDSYHQPHRKLYLLTVRDSDIARDDLGDLAPPVTAELQMRKLRDAANYRRGRTDGSRWVAIGEVERHYDPHSNVLQVRGRGSVLKMNRRSYEWSCGYGFAKWMRSIDTIRQQDGHTLIEGTMRLIEDDETRFKIQLDRELIVRNATISIPGRRGGFDEYLVDTSGTTPSVKGAPLVAKQGHYKRILKPVGKREVVSDDYHVFFVSLSEPLTDEQYETLTTITPKKDATIVDRTAR